MNDPGQTLFMLGQVGHIVGVAMVKKAAKKEAAKGDNPDFGALMATMAKRARGLQVDKVISADVAMSGGGGVAEE